MVQTEHVLHIRYMGKSWDIPLEHFDIGQNTPDEAILEQVEGYLSQTGEPVEAGELRGMTVQKHANGNITVAPTAVYG